MKAMFPILLLLVSCQAPKHEESRVSSFFTNSLRRSASKDELKFFVHLPDVGCTAFPVENSDNQSIFITARHCVMFDETNWCSQKSRLIDNDGHEGTCLKILASDERHDIMLFEADYRQENFKNMQPLRLAAFKPKIASSLRMYGYPADEFRDGLATVTEDCWVTSDFTASPFLDDRALEHNCTTFGGNSGGPMVLQGTRTVVGLPGTYNPFDRTPHKPDDKANIAVLLTIESFVETHRLTLDELKVSIDLDEQPGAEFPEPEILLSPEAFEFMSYCKSKGHSRAQLKTLNALKELADAHDCELLSFRLSQVSEIALVDQGLTDVSVFNEKIFANNLRALTLDGNPLPFLDISKGPEQLKYLSLSRTHLSNLKGWNKLRRLETLNISNNSLVKLCGILRFGESRALLQLDVSGNAIIDSKELRNIVEISPSIYLNLSDNKIKSHEGLSGPFNLFGLVLKGNPIVNISAISTWTELAYLDIQKTPLSTLTDLENVPNLNQIILGQNSGIMRDSCLVSKPEICIWN